MRNPDAGYAVYLRQSLDRTGQMLAISRQRGPCLELCDQRGWTNRREYVDNDRSATKGRRPAYEDMIADVEAGKIRGIVAWDLDRLYRRPTELEHLIDLAEKDGLLLATITGDADLATDNGRLFARIKAAVAKAEMERKAARQAEQHKQRAEAGIPWGNRRIFGFTADRKPHPAEAGLVRDAYSLLLSGGSLGSVAATWNAGGVTTSLGNPWDGPRVSQLLRNPAHAGLRARNGEIVGPGNWEGIVSEDVWRSASSVLSSPDRNPRPGSRARKYLLTGIALCGGRCGGRSTLSSGKSNRGAALYRCSTCFGVGRSQPALDDHVITLVARRLSKADARELVVDRKCADIGTLLAESATLQGRLDALANEFADGELTASQLRTASQRLRSKLVTVEAAMADAERVRIFDGIIGADDVEAVLRAVSLARRRAVVATLVTITVLPTRRGARFDPDSISIEWRS